ncbi:hypothetical protein EJ110_NYTH39817 [Nymphaea thermarum]|nr:hypothetical protein EJ110_NYTH39817 [Nymphaea thermarum]
MGIAARDRMTYIDGSNPEPARTSGVWRTWFLEDNQVKTWIVNSISPEIQPLILRKKTAWDMWVVLEQMYGQKKTNIRTYQVMKTVYNLRQGSSSVAEYYGALKAKVFLFLAGLNDEFEGVRSQILNSGEVSSIEDVYSSVEAEEQRRLVTNEGKRDFVPSHARSVLVTSIRLTKDNYLSWSAALEIGITSRGRLSYITGDKPAPLKYDLQWATWTLEDSQVKVWIISSVSSDIHPLILRKPTSFDMWTVLAKMYGRKKRHLRTYQIKRSIYSLTQGDLSVAAFYAALKTKWEELDYHVTDEWKCGSDHSLYWEKEWMDRTFLFLGGLRDEFESIRSQILNGDEIPGIEEVYARVESEEQRRQVMHLTTGNAPSAFVNRASGTVQRPARRCTHCNKLGHSVDFCWDLHPEKRLVRGRPPSGRRSPSVSDSSQSTPSSGVKTKLSPDQLKELQAYIGRLSTTPEESSAVPVLVRFDTGTDTGTTLGTSWFVGDVGSRPFLAFVDGRSAWGAATEGYISLSTVRG